MIDSILQGLGWLLGNMITLGQYALIGLIVWWCRKFIIVILVMWFIMMLYYQGYLQI